MNMVQNGSMLCLPTSIKFHLTLFLDVQLTVVASWCRYSRVVALAFVLKVVIAILKLCNTVEPLLVHGVGTMH